MASLPDWSDDDLNAAAPFLNASIDQYGLDGALIYGQCSQESRFKPNAFLMDSNGGSYGLMQMSYPTAQSLGYTGDPDGLYDPATNVDLGCHFMANLLAKYGGDESKALSAYNSGSPTSTAGAAYVALVMPRVQYFEDLFASQDTPDDTGDGTTPTPGLSAIAVIGAVALVGAALAYAMRGR